ncbi:hypothetical protein O181_061167 [Austropuccinia psidii MF-1]|uniref:ubiquitinyl hydrolase 1 n=1 Tax=Austropuccinia psidii MF-1 TaxID=1389203 RepID=A0A9Q3EK42_9BASI|nr:hypothetical protein [Austropuccinia psidii MF-1]
MSLFRWMGVNSITNQPLSNSNANQNQNQNQNQSSKDDWWSKSGEKYFGMENFGNTCYVNSVLQALYFCKPFRQLLELSSNSHLMIPQYLSRNFLSNSQSPLKSLPIQNHSNHHHRPSSISNPSNPQTPTKPKHSSKSISPKSPQNHSNQSKPYSSDSQKATSTNHKLDLTPPRNFIHNELSQASSLSSSTCSNLTNLNHSNLTKRHWDLADMDQGGIGSFRSTDSSGSNPTVGLHNSTLVAQPDSTIYSTLRDLFQHISRQSKPVGAVAPQAFITTLKRYNKLFRSTMHQDAHEFLNYLINSIAEDVIAEQEKKSQEDENSLLLEPCPSSFQKNSSKSSTEPPSTWVHKLFEGILTNETKCLTCETITQRDESFLDLSIDIDQNTSLTACLRQFSASEMLCQKNKFSCDRCCSLQEAEKRMKIKKLPNVLALHLKRFKYQEKLQRYTKLSYRVVFPFELRLFNTTHDIPDPDRLYELWAIVVHIGAGPHHGHYVTILKSSGQWLLFDDDVVTRIEEHDIQKYYGDTPGFGSGYVLFYQATDLNLAQVIGISPDSDDDENEDFELDSDGETHLSKSEDDDTLAGLLNPHSLHPVPIDEDQEILPWNAFQSNSSDDDQSDHQTPSLPHSPFTHDSIGPSTDASSPPSSAYLLEKFSTNSHSNHLNSSNRHYSIGSGIKNIETNDKNSHLSPIPLSTHPDQSTSAVLDVSTRPIDNLPGPSVTPVSHSNSIPINDSSHFPRTNPNLLPRQTNSTQALKQLTSSDDLDSLRETNEWNDPVDDIALGSPKNEIKSATLNRKFSTKLLKRAKSSKSYSALRASLPELSMPFENLGLVVKDEKNNALSMLSVNENQIRSRGSSTPPTQSNPSTCHETIENHRLSPLNGSTVQLDHSISGTEKIWRSVHSNLEHGTRNNLLPGPQTTSASKAVTSIHQRSLLTTTRGAQAPPVNTTLNEKQQKEIKKATEKASKLAAKELAKSLKEKEKVEKNKFRAIKKLDQKLIINGNSNSKLKANDNQSPSQGSNDEHNYNIRNLSKLSSGKERFNNDGIFK